MQQLVKDYPYDRAAEFEAAREVPRKLAEREYWAKEALVSSSRTRSKRMASSKILTILDDSCTQTTSIQVA